MTFAKGENVGPYRIIEQLGQGGMATVFKAYHPALDRYVAIKALHPAMMEDPSFLARFEREAKVVAKLDHPNIVPIYDFSEHGGRPYLVMKFIQGETLKARLGRGPLSKREALSIVEAVGDALTYAHKRGYLHRDIKPSNILLTPEGHIYLADFGLARIAEAGASTLSGDMLMGTPQYISPEQARGETELDAGTDIYSFGVVIYELVVGRVPFTADTPFSIIHDHIYTPLPLPSKVNPAVPEVVERILLKSLAKDRDDRFQSVEDMVAAFRSALTPGGVGVLESHTLPSPQGETRAGVGDLHEPSPESPSRPPPSDDLQVGAVPDAHPKETKGARGRRRWLWIVGGLVLTCLIAFGFLAALGEYTENANSPPVEEPLMREPADPLEAPVRKEGDPEVHIRRAEALLEEGDEAGAFEQLIRAGDLFLSRDEFVPAAETYLWAMDLSPPSMRDDRKTISNLTQALFLGAPEPSMRPMLKRLHEENPEWDALRAALARAEFHAGMHEEAWRWLDPLLEQKPDDALGNAVVAEHFLMVEDFDAAREHLDRLLSDQVLPPWLREHLVTLREAVPE